MILAPNSIEQAKTLLKTYNCDLFFAGYDAIDAMDKGIFTDPDICIDIMYDNAYPAVYSVPAGIDLTQIEVFQVNEEIVEPDNP